MTRAAGYGIPDLAWLTLDEIIATLGPEDEECESTPVESDAAFSL